jgi:uncharacterized membrane protein YfcA
VVWVVLGVVLLALFVPSGRLGLGELQCIGALTPPFLLGVWLGDWGHRHVDERRFRVVVYCALVVAGAIVAR